VAVYGDRIDERRAGSRSRRTFPIPSHAAAPWPLAPAARRQRARRTGIGVLAMVAVVIAAAWAVPPMLDWNRFRGAISTIVGAELGRKVVIGGDVALRLLPQAVLTATDVTVPDGGDGMSARIASLRLEVGLGPLLAGRLVVRDLVLGSPVITLPWPLPNSVVSPARPSLPHAFAAHVENGTLHAGLAAITGITAAIHGGPAPADAPGAGPVATFGAEGFAAFDGQRWRFTTALGAPDADGVSAVDLAVQGEGPAHDTGGAIQGTLADGVLQGHLHAAGSDLSLLMPASALAWRAEAPFTASGERIESAALTLSLGGAPASASFTLQLAPPTRFDAHLTAASLDLDGWSRLFSGTFAGFAPPSIPMRLDLSAGRGRLLGGTLGALSGLLVFDGEEARVENIQAMLPGSARLQFSGRIERGSGGKLTADGPAKLEAPDLHATLAWLRPMAPALFAAVPDHVLRSASLTGTARLTPGRLSVSGMSGQLDNSLVSGGFDFAFGVHPTFSAQTHFDHVSIDDWLLGARLHPGMPLDAAVKPFTANETNLRIGAASATWRGKAFTNVLLDAATGAGGVRLNQATASTPDFTVALSGALASDGTLSGFHLHGSTPDLARLVATLPQVWRVPAVPIHAPARLTASGEGPPGALGLQMRAETGDLVVEADQHRDTASGAADTTLTLRHPSTSSLLDMLGVPGTKAWLGDGSTAFLAHLHTAPGVARVSDFTLNAADLHLRGHGDVSYAGAAPAISLDLDADQLALPGVDELPITGLPFAALPAGWQVDAKLSASNVELGLRPAAQDLSAEIAAAEDNVVIDLRHAIVAGGVLSAQAAADATRAPMLVAVRAALSKATLAGKISEWPIGVTSGNADLDLDLSSLGDTWRSLIGGLSGDAHLAIRESTLTGLSLAHLDRAFAGRTAPSRASLLDALTTGETGGLSGAADIAIDQGHASIASAALSSSEGTVSVAGKFALADSQADLTIGVTPSLQGSTMFAIRLTGAGTNVKSSVDLGKFEPRARRPERRARHRS